MSTLFIADLHLDESRPDIVQLFVRFLREEAARAAALYILGDLFETWIGDDAPNAAGDAAAAGLAELRRQGVPCFYIHGNRDFLLGDAWARRAGLSLLPDPSLIAIEGKPVLLMHGDRLCTDDVAYQTFRARSHTPAWQHEFLARSLAERKAIAAGARAESRRHTATVDERITDVNPEAVSAALRAQGARLLIHGHTHRPADHAIRVDGEPARRIVLGDWYEQGSVLRLRDGRFELATLPLASATVRPPSAP